MDFAAFLQESCKKVCKKANIAKFLARPSIFLIVFFCKLLVAGESHSSGLL